jgi:tetratricopeptide (TPR) repeat protein
MSTATLIELERAAITDPDNADLRYLLGAHYAQLGQYEQAARELYRSISLNPQAHVARFQLGLLYLTLGDTHRTISTLGPLEALQDSAALKLFKRGLEALINEDFVACARLLDQGMAANSANPALNADMRLILAKLPQPKKPDTTAMADAVNQVRTDFSLYTTTRH